MPRFSICFLLLVWWGIQFCRICYFLFFFFMHKTAYEMRISDWISDVCSSDLCEKQSYHSPRQNRPCVREHSVHRFLQKLNPAFLLPVPGFVHHLPANPPEQADSPASLLRDIPAGMALPLPKRLLPERLLLLPGWKRFFRKEFLQLSLYVPLKWDFST